MQNKQIVKVTWGAIHSTKLPTGVVHLKRWTSFFETFPVGPNRSIAFWTEISGKFGKTNHAHEYQRCLEGRIEGFHVSLWFLKVMWPVEYRVAKKCHYFHHCRRLLHHHYSRGCQMRFYLMKQSLEKNLFT